MAEEHVRAAIEGAVEAAPARGAGGEAEGRRRRGGLPDDCPVVPLGVNGDFSFYLDACRQLRALKAGEHGRLHIQHLFAPRDAVLYKAWPQFDKDGNPKGTWDAGQASAALMNAAALAGIWDAAERERGPGAWAGPDGELILHLGDGVLVGRGGRMTPGEYPPGLVDGHVYPGAAPLNRPDDAGVTPDEAGKLLFDLIRSWPWKRAVDARLLTGWIAAALVGGALDWRPMCWLTGGSGSGKSTMQKLIQMVLGPALVRASEATAAGIWQAVGKSSRAVAIDEAEASEDNRKIQKVIELARQAASGGLILRGGAEHKGQSFTVQSCFLFSSINVPPLDDQDRSRMAILELGAIGAGAPPPKLDRGELARAGQAVLWRLMTKWHLLDDLLETYRVAMAQQGWDSRGIDQFGTLLALADLALHGTEADAGHAAETIAELGQQMRAERTSDQQAMLNHLLTTHVDPWKKGEQRMLGEWIRRAGGLKWSRPEFPDMDEVNEAEKMGEAERVLAMYGLRVQWARLDPRQAEAEQVLWLANDHQGLAQVFAHTKWGGRAGTTGVWKQAALRLAGAASSPNTVYFKGGTSLRAAGVPLSTVFPEGQA